MADHTNDDLALMLLEIRATLSGLTSQLEAVASRMGTPAGVPGEVLSILQDLAGVQALLQRLASNPILSHEFLSMMQDLAMAISKVQNQVGPAKTIEWRFEIDRDPTTNLIRSVKAVPSGGSQ